MVEVRAAIIPLPFSRSVFPFVNCKLTIIVFKLPNYINCEQQGVVFQRRRAESSLEPT